MSTFSPLKPLGQLKLNFIWSLHGLGESKLIQMVRPSFFNFLIYEKIFKMLESGGRNKNKNKNSKIEESKKKKKKKRSLITFFFFFKPLIKIKSNTKYLVFQLVQIHKFQVGS